MSQGETKPIVFSFYVQLSRVGAGVGDGGQARLPSVWGGANAVEGRGVHRSAQNLWTQEGSVLLEEEQTGSVSE